MFVEPAVCRAKFDREVANFRGMGAAYHRHGIWLIEATFPEVFVVLVATNVKPPFAAFGVVLNFENYDVQPPSLRFVHPLTREPLKMSEIGSNFPAIVPVAGPGVQGGQMTLQGLVQGFADDRPFFCLQGVREYHENPAHSGDSWFLHRQTGMGTLAHLLEVLVKYGTEPIKAITVQIQVQGQSVGYVLSPPAL